MIVYLTSCLDLYEKDEEGNRIPHHFGNENKILDNLRRHIKKSKRITNIKLKRTN